MVHKLRLPFLKVTALPAEHWSRRYMAQPWGGKAAAGYRVLMGQIKRELHDPLHRCPDCEEPYIPTMAAWPGKAASRKDKRQEYNARRYLICPYCGHKAVLAGKLKRPPVFTDAQIAQMRDLYALEMTPREIAKLLHCHPGTVLRYVRLADIVRPRGGSKPLRGVSHTDMERIRYLYEHQGWTQAQIAKHLGIGKSTVQTRVKRGGMVRRGRSPVKRRARPERKERVTV